ncbi:MAG TPA: hypothetical protein VGM88_17175 [Kofleriaceae bacterium]|jgi:hypothetical protein
MRIFPIVGLLGLLELTTGLTDCSEYSTVTVPATDTTRPSTWDGLMVDDNYVALVTNPDTHTYNISPGESAFAVSSGLDGGGVAGVSMAASVFWECCLPNDPNDPCVEDGQDFAPNVETQNGIDGSQVSNGVYTFQEITGPATSLCTTDPNIPPFFTHLSWWEFDWTTTTWDFHDNTTTGGMQSVVFDNE